MRKINTIGILVSALVVLAIAGNLVLVENLASAQAILPNSPEHIISVTGVASTAVQPDILLITFGVETQDETASMAYVKNSESMNAIVAAITILGIPDKDLSTSRLSIFPTYDYFEDEDGRNHKELTGYEVNNILTVKTVQLDLAANIIDSAIDNGANRVENVSFTFSPETKLQIKDNLVEQAVINARIKAELALTPLDYHIIGVAAIDLSDFPMYPQPSPYSDFRFTKAQSSSSAPIFSQDQDLHTSAHVVFLIERN